MEHIIEIIKVWYTYNNIILSETLFYDIDLWVVGTFLI